MINDPKIVHAVECECLSWKPIVAGALAAIGFTFLLNLFSVAIGLTAFTTNSEGVESLVLGGLIGTSIGILAAMFAAGWIAGYLGKGYCTKRHIGALYGFLTWTVALLIAVLFAGYFQQYVSFYGHFISGTGHAVISNAAEMKQAAISVNSTSDANIVASAYILFCLFFLGAFASSLGGHCGMRHVCRKTVC